MCTLTHQNQASILKLRILNVSYRNMQVAILILIYSGPHKQIVSWCGKTKEQDGTVRLSELSIDFSVRRFSYRLSQINP